MIFVCVGTQVPFERLLDAVSEWRVVNPSEHVVAQVGKGGTSRSGLQCFETLDKASFDKILKSASLIVSHAGMGAIISALCAGVPIIIMPRRADLMEHRNDHQIATARAMESKQGVTVAWEACELKQALDRRRELSAGALLSEDAPDAFISELRRLTKD